ncbi:MAG TPA: acyl-ACP--UDP-N-acetylglucosamine O-acyltransferase [Bryobacteraceae bacterium]|nr:acyl-ACP--UDP-N-acetylglucosamine O-acyltransferase [Bryobacteraceae bacterium]
MPVHPTAIIDPAAAIDPTADIGPYCVIGPEVEIGARTRLMAGIYMEGPLSIGEDNLFFPHATIGVASQDKKYKGERAYTHIGNRNTIRECVTIHRGTEGGGLHTRIGDDNLIMAYSHIAHDVIVGNHCILGNQFTTAGHVIIEDHATISAGSAIHQFCRIGRHAFIGGYSVVTQDVMPFSSVVSEREIRVFGANRVGLERRGFTRDSIESLQTAFRLLTRAGLNTSQAVERIRAEVPPCAELDELLAFIAASERGVIKG